MKEIEKLLLVSIWFLQKQNSFTARILASAVKFSISKWAGEIKRTNKRVDYFTF